MGLQTIASRYARALADVTIERKESDQVLDELYRFSALLNDNADVTAPGIALAFAYPSVAGAVATHDQIIVEFTEPVTPASVGSAASYTVPGGGNPVSVVITNDPLAPEVVGTPPILTPFRAEHTPARTAYRWQPERSPTGPLSIVVSGRDRRIVVMRRGVEIGSSGIDIDGAVTMTEAW